MIRNLFLQIISGIVGLWVACQLVTGVEFLGDIKGLFLVGLVLGLANCFLKPILRVITTPLRIISFGLSTLVINMLIVWGVADILFPQVLEIKGILPLFWTTIIVWGLSLFLNLFSKGKVTSSS